MNTNLCYGLRNLVILLLVLGLIGWAAYEFLTFQPNEGYYQRMKEINGLL